MESFLFQATIYLGAAVIAVPFAARMGLGSVLGYLAAGIVIGPMTGLVGTETQDLQHFAEFGVVMMLFLIGLELEPRALWNMRDRLVGLGGLQISLTILLIMGGAMAMGYAWTIALAIGMIFALSSTAIVLQTLSEKGLMQTNGGRATFSVLLSQDIAVIPMLAILPLLAVSTLASIATGIFLTRPIFRYIHHARLREMYTAIALLIVASIAVLMTLVGLSPALGTFLAGVVLANSEFRHELESDLEPFKGLLLGLFFITVGAGIDFALFFREPGMILALTIGVMTIKGGVLYALSLLFKIKGKDRWLFALGLAQAGEFGFILISFSLQQEVLSPGLGDRLLLIVALSMLITPLLFIAYDVLGKRITESHDMAHDDVDEQGTVIIAGIGRFGQIVNRLVQSAGFSTVVIDNDLSTVQMMRTFGFKGYFGDPTRPDLLKAAGLNEAKVLVVAIDDKKMANKLVAYARKARPDLHIIARARDRVHVYELNAAGANDVVRELFDSSLRAGRYALENLGLTEFEANEAETFFYEHDRAAIRELSTHWKPGIPLRNNPEYVALAKAINNDLETALATKQQAKETTRDAKKGRGGP